jgi:1,5-anhydro-D-fructose reductase (1,5-anhydro-D-mannitol-forming)
VAAPLNIAVLGFWHVHAHEYGNDALAHPDTRLVAAWDPDPEIARTEAAKLGVDAVADLDELLARPDLDGVTITTATNEHDDVIGRALRAGKHVFSEKLLSPTLDGCREFIALAAERGLSIGVSLPRFSQPDVIAALDAVRSGKLGDIAFARVRLAHDGWVGGWLVERFGDPVAAIGGALTDLGCHPVYLVQALLGARPASVAASYGWMTGHQVEDHAVVTSTYADGALGVAEASFVQGQGSFQIEVHGTRGSLLHGFGREGVIVRGDAWDPKAWTELDLPERMPKPFALWVDAIRRGEHPATLAPAVELTRLVVAANRSAAEGRAVTVPTLEEEPA